MASKISGIRQLWGRYNYTTLRELNIRNKLIQNDTHISKCYAFTYIPRSVYMICKIRNRCVYTNRARAVLKQFKLARMSFKNLAISGFLNGVKKHSW